MLPVWENKNEKQHTAIKRRRDCCSIRPPCRSVRHNRWSMDPALEPTPRGNESLDTLPLLKRKESKKRERNGMPHIRPTSLSQSLRCMQRVVVPVCDRVSGFLFVRDVKNTHIVSCVGDERMQHSSFVHKGNKHVMLSGLGFSSIPSGHWYFSHVAVPEIHPHTPGQTDRKRDTNGPKMEVMITQKESQSFHK